MDQHHKPFDPDSDDLLTLAAAARTLPRRHGRAVHPSTVFRWITRGLRGHHLRCVRVGGSRMVTGKMLQEFFERLTAEDADACGHPPPNSKSREREIAQAEARLSRAGI